MARAYVPNQTAMGLLYIGLLIYAAVAGFKGWPYYVPPMAFLVFWVIYMKLMPEEERRFLKATPGLLPGKFIGRGLLVVIVWGLATAVRG